MIAARHGHNNQLTVASVCGGAGSSFCGVGSRRGGDAGVVLTNKDLSMLDSSLFNFFQNFGQFNLHIITSFIAFIYSPLPRCISRFVPFCCPICDRCLELRYFFLAHVGFFSSAKHLFHAADLVGQRLLHSGAMVSFSRCVVGDFFTLRLIWSPLPSPLTFLSSRVAPSWLLICFGWRGRLLLFFFRRC